MSTLSFGIDFALKTRLPAIDKQIVIVTDDNVYNLYTDAFPKDAFVISIPPGEKSKTREMKQSIEDQMLDRGIGKDCVLVAIGGGVITDLAGFVASTYLRGIDLILIPTSLLGMVDAAIGGKTAINTSCGKNLIGSFYPAKQVWIDEAFLETLPHEEKQNGLVEMIKAGLIASRELFDLDLMQCIKKSIQIKQEIVEKDPFELLGIRRSLNLGHTLGHAIEVCSGYTISHGKAVSIGIAASCLIAEKMGIFKERAAVEKILRLYDLPLACNLSPEKLMATLQFDKKRAGGNVRFVLLESIGKVHPFEGEYCTKVPLSILEEVLTCHV